MKRLIIILCFALLLAACSRNDVLKDGETGRVTRVYRAIEYSKNMPNQNVFGSALTFARVERNGEAVMIFKTDREYEVRGQPGHLLSSKDHPTTLFGVLESSFDKQSVVIEYEAWNFRKKI